MAKFIKCRDYSNDVIINVDRIVKVYSDEEETDGNTRIVLDRHLSNSGGSEYIDVEETPEEIFEKLNRLGCCQR